MPQLRLLPLLPLPLCCCCPAKLYLLQLPTPVLLCMPLWSPLLLLLSLQALLVCCYCWAVNAASIAGVLVLLCWKWSCYRCRVVLPLLLSLLALLLC